MSLWFICVRIDGGICFAGDVVEVKGVDMFDVNVKETKTPNLDEIIIVSHKMTR
jgi:hypothetical protein